MPIGADDTGLMPALSADQALLVEARVAHEKHSVGLAYLLFFLFGPLGVQSLYLQRFSLAGTEALLTIVGFGVMSLGHVYLGFCCGFFLGLFLLYDLWTIGDCVREHAEAIRRTLSQQLKAAASIRVDPVLASSDDPATSRARQRPRGVAEVTAR